MGSSSFVSQGPVFRTPAEHTGVRKWYVLTTKHRQERIVARELCGQGLNCFCPTFRRPTDYAGVQVLVEVPIAPDQTYLFADDQELEVARESRRVLQFRQIDPSEVQGAAGIVPFREWPDRLATGQ